jgi:hypothetical protein
MSPIERKKVSSQDMCLYYVQNYFLKDQMATREGGSE